MRRTSRWPCGDAFEFTIKADYYFGGPVKEGKVKYKVQRSVHTSHWFPAGRWDWLFGEGYGWRSDQLPVVSRCTELVHLHRRVGRG